MPLHTITRATLAALLGLGLVTAQAAPADYQIDADHTYATFAIDHHGASVNRARFGDVAGSVRFDPEARSGAIDITVQAASVYSGSKGFDEPPLKDDRFSSEPNMLPTSATAPRASHSITAPAYSGA